MWRNNLNRNVWSLWSAKDGNCPIRNQENQIKKTVIVYVYKFKIELEIVWIVLIKYRVNDLTKINVFFRVFLSDRKLLHLYHSSSSSSYMKCSFFLYNCTTDLHNSKTKGKLNIRTTEPYLIYNDHVEQNNDHKYCLQSFLVEVKHLIEKHYVLCVLQRETPANV